MQNPWLKLQPEPPFILEIDRDKVDAFNRSADSKHRLHFEVLPQPFAGNINTADVYLLSLNPGFSDKDEYYQQIIPAFREANEQSLMLDDTGFFFLDPRFSETPAYKWWSKHLREVISALDTETAMRRLMVVEFFPYHSISYKGIKNILPSQEFSFDLVRKAIKNNHWIVIMRSEKRWLEQIPELRNYRKCVSLKNPQNPCISIKNLPDRKFQEMFK